MKIISINLFFILISCSTQNKKEEIVKSSFLRGKYLYNTHCITCHGHDGSGNGIAACARD
ncbi:MAG: cytochrome c [Bacteriovoracaceae bacterium]|nr:cytochrome c [Bacteriovoracaceae bacterium]